AQNPDVVPAHAENVGRLIHDLRSEHTTRLEGDINPLLFHHNHGITTGRHPVHCRGPGGADLNIPSHLGCKVSHHPLSHRTAADVPGTNEQHMFAHGLEI